MAELELWALGELVDFLGVSRQRTLKLTQRHDFPAPVAVLGVGRIWLAEDVREWQRKRRERYPGPADGAEDL